MGSAVTMWLSELFGVVLGPASQEWPPAQSLGRVLATTTSSETLQPAWLANDTCFLLNCPLVPPDALMPVVSWGLMWIASLLAGLLLLRAMGFNVDRLPFWLASLQWEPTALFEKAAGPVYLITHLIMTLPLFLPIGFGIRVYQVCGERCR